MCYRVLLDILNCSEVCAFEFCSTFFMVQKRAASSSPRCILCTEVDAVEFCSTFNMVQIWTLLRSARHLRINWLSLLRSARHIPWYRNGRCRVLQYFLRGTDVGADVFCSKFYMVQMWTLSRYARHSKGT